jgi:glycine oxidase
VIIVGGGIIGCSTGLRLAQAGLKVTILERGRVGGEATQAAAGMLTPQTGAVRPDPFFDLCLRSRAMYPAFVDEMRELSAIDPQYRGEGMLVLSLDDRDEASIDGWATWQSEAGLSLERLTAERIKGLEPSVTDRVRGGVMVPGDHQVDNRLLINAVRTSALRAGVEIVEAKQADALLIAQDRASGVACRDEIYSAGCVVVAAGCWSSALLETAGLIIPITPARGQMVAVRSDVLPIRHLVHSSKCYLVPRLDGRILIGATVEYAGFRKAVTTEGIRSLLEAGVEIVPALDRFEIVETWSGLRPDTADHLPLLGPGGPDGLILATGHFRNGILLAPITAQLITDTIIKGQLPEEFRPFGANRLKKSGESGESGTLFNQDSESQ